MDLIVEAFAATPDRKLVVIGDGPEMAKIKAKAGPNIEILGYQSDAVLRDLLQRARAFVFAAEEDFGITLVEAQACGTPVIALGKGGATEIVVGLGQAARPTGVFFRNQEVAQLIAAVDTFEQHEDSFDPARCRSNALRFSRERFRSEFARYVLRCRFEAAQRMRAHAPFLAEAEAPVAALVPSALASGTGAGAVSSYRESAKAAQLYSR
jgi:glycosyltransferase involved in cell wall biosynthesis